jgi:hypothetical protein
MTEAIEYRIERLRSRLAYGAHAELGLRIEPRGGGVRVSGTVPDAECREAVLRAVAEELADLELLLDVVIAATDPPAHAEQL